MKEQSNFWRKVLERVINIILTLTKLCLPFRRHREIISEGECEGGNFLGLVCMQAKFEPLLQEVTCLPACSTKYLSPKIQSEIISDMFRAVKTHLITKIKNRPFYAVIIDTTSDIS